MKTRPTGKRKKASNRMSQVADGVISPRSRKKRRRLGALKGWMKIKGDIIHSDMEDDWEAQRNKCAFTSTRGASGPPEKTYKKSPAT